MAFKYLASPYTDADKSVMLRRFQAAEDCLAYFLKQRIWMYSPIVHCHQLALNHELPPDHLFWDAYDKAMILSSTGVYVLLMEGTSQSKGVQKERDFARENHIQVSVVDIYDSNYRVHP